MSSIGQRYGHIWLKYYRVRIFGAYAQDGMKKSFCERQGSCANVGNIVR